MHLLEGIEAAAAIGVLGGDENAYLQVISKVPEEAKMKEITDGIRQLLEDKDNPQAAARLEKAVSLLKGSDLKNMLSQELSKAWRLDPQSVADKGKVQEFYEKLNEDTKMYFNYYKSLGYTDAQSFTLSRLQFSIASSFFLNMPSPEQGASTRILSK